MSRASPDFDAGALCIEALKQDIGLSVSTSDPATFKRRMYEHMARHPAHKLSILTGPTPSTFFLVKPAAMPEPPAPTNP